MGWQEDWDERLRRWIDARTQDDMGTWPILDAYFDDAEPDAMLDRLALPEPYVGDPRWPGLAAVILGLNPGQTLPAQRHPDGALVRLVRERGWSAVAAGWMLPPETRAWWRERAAWPARLTGLPAGERSIVGMDLLPWHSIRFGRLLLHDRHVGPGALRWLEREVVGPAVRIASRAALQRLSPCERRRPVLLGLAAGVRHVLESLGWTRLAHVDRFAGRALGARWPLDEAGAPVERTFSVLLQPEAPWAIALVTDAPDGMLRPPEAAFDPLVVRLLREHGCPCAAAHAVVPVRVEKARAG